MSTYREPHEPTPAWAEVRHTNLGATIEHPVYGKGWLAYCEFTFSSYWFNDVEPPGVYTIVIDGRKDPVAIKSGTVVYVPGGEVTQIAKPPKTSWWVRFRRCVPAWGVTHHSPDVIRSLFTEQTVEGIRRASIIRDFRDCFNRSGVR